MSDDLRVEILRRLPNTEDTLLRSIYENPENIQEALKKESKNPGAWWYFDGNEWIRSVRGENHMKYNNITPLVSDHEKKKSPLDYFDGKQFVPKRLADDIMKDYIFRTLRDNETLYFYDNGVYKENAECIVKDECGQILEDMSTSNRANETIFHIKISTYTPRNNAPLDLINVKNGMFDLKDSQLREHTPDIFTLSQLPVIYDPKADCVNIKEFLNQTVAECDIPILQEMVGFCMYREYFIHKAFMFLGDGRNGKSTLLNVIIELLGQDNVSSVALQLFDTNRFAAGRLYGKLANIYADIPVQAMKNTGSFKMVTGQDYITGEKKFKDHFQFTNHAKLLFSANMLPETHDESGAYFSRWILINFPNKFEGKNADKKLLKKLTTNEELSGLLNWGIEGLKRLLKKGEFSSSITTEQTRDRYERMSSPVKAFLMDCVKEKMDSMITKDDFYKAFIQYCNKNGLPTIANNVFGRKIKEFAPFLSSQQATVDDKKGVRVWKGGELI
jgi:putative DNA primase/helicase